MKNLFKVCFVLFFVGGMFSCNQSSDLSDTTTQKSTTNVSQLAGGRICFYLPSRGILVPTWPRPGLACVGSAYRCHLFRQKICIELPIPICKLIPCWIDPIDPWVIYPELKPDIFESFLEYAPDDIDPLEDIAVFPVNEGILGVQFYAFDKTMMDEKSITFKNSFELSEEMAAEYGLKGNVVPAGNYPLIYNKENETYNALLAVRTFPIKQSSAVVRLTPKSFEGSLNELFETSSYSVEKESVASEIELRNYVIAPNYEEQDAGIYAFTPTEGGLGIIMHGGKTDLSEFSKIWLDDAMKLPAKLADMLSTEVFELKPDQVYYQYHEEQNSIYIWIAD